MLKKRLSGVLAFVLLFQMLLGGLVSATSVEVKTDFDGHWAEADIEYLISKSIVQGVASDSGLKVQPNRNITRAEYVTLLIRSVGVTEKLPSKVAFTDLDGHWAKKDIETANALGIINGYADNTFQPNKALTRAEMAAMVVQAFKLKPVEKSAVSFSDVPSTSWEYPYINTLVSKKAVKGYGNGEFRPSDLTTRAESMTVLSKVLKDTAPASVDVMMTTTEFVAGDSVSISLVEQAKQGFTFEVTTTSGEYSIKDDIVTWKLPKTSGDHSLKITFKFTTDSGRVETYEREVKVTAKAAPTETKPSDSSSGSGSGSSPTPTPITPIPTLLAWGNDYLGDVVEVGADLPFTVTPDVSLVEPVTYTWTVSGGTVTPSGSSALWVVQSEGEYTLTVKATDANEVESNTLSKTFSAVDLGGAESFTGFIAIESNDYDNDGLTNDEELALGTDQSLSDTDADGLSDFDEVNTTNTSPTQADTDGDGVLDGEEVALGTDPLVADSDGNGTPDGEELYTFVDSTQAGVTASVYGRSNVASVTVEQADNFLSTAYGVATPIYEFELDGTFEHADLAFTYNPAELADKGLDENNLSVYYVNEEYGQLELVPSVVDTATGTVTGRVTHFSKYVVADKTKVSTEVGAVDFVFVIDNSGSMTWTDPEDLRFDAVASLLDVLKGDFRFGVVQFADYAEVSHALSTDKNSVGATIPEISWTIGGGTAIGSALSESISVFDDSDRRKVIVLLTDGEDFDTWSIENAVAEAKSKDIQVFTVGLGDGVDAYLLEEVIAKPAGGAYFSVNNAQKLADTFGAIATTIDGEIVDFVVGTVSVKGEIVAKSAFDPKKHGYNFANNVLTEIQDSGMCQGFAMTTYFYYDKAYPYSKSQTTSGGKTLPAYNTSGVDGFDSYKNLYLHDNIFGNLSRQVRASRQDKGGILAINDTLKKALLDAGFTIKVKTQGDLKYEAAILDTSSSKINTAEEKEDIEVIKSILWWWGVQESSNSLEVDSLDEITSEIKEKGTAVINFYGSGVGHAVNAFQVIKDKNNKKVYWLAIYDNNFPGETRYLKLTKAKDFMFFGNQYNVSSSDYSWAKGAVRVYID